MSAILEVDSLKVHFPVRKGVFSRVAGYVKAVDGISFSMERGETLAIVGESGCGKSTTARTILRLVKPTAGRILVGGEDVSRFSGKSLMAYRRRVQAVFQDPLASLNPRHSILEAVTEGMVVHGLCPESERREKGAALLAAAGLEEDLLDRWPHELSGGQRQRVCIARAIALKPEILICDEAVSALDLSIRAQVLDLLESLKKELGLSILFITHDLGVVQNVAGRVLVMNAGKIVESGKASEVLAHPSDPYTRALVAASPTIEARGRFRKNDFSANTGLTNGG